MFDIFSSILSMAGNYEARKVTRFEDADNLITVDTCSVSDGHHPYETGIEHPEYNGGLFIIVEAYDTIEDAQKGHDKWIEIITHEPLPVALEDCQNSEITDHFGKLIYPRERR